MKRVYTIVAILAGAIVLSTLPVLAGEGATAQQGRFMHKDECLLVAKLVTDNCPNQSDSIQGKIARLNREIAKGADVYTSSELRTLTRERAEYAKIWRYINNNEPSDVY